MHKIVSIIYLCFMSQYIYAEKKPENIYTQDKLTIFITKNNAEFKLKLKSNPSTGFKWFLRDYNYQMITPVQHVFLSANNIGANGFEVWTFHVKPQAFTVPRLMPLRFVYARPWQAENTTQLVFQVYTE
jgi:inhibitor of cysteine peptidase